MATYQSRGERLTAVERVLAWRLAEKGYSDTESLMDAMWAGDPDGGPLTGARVVYVHLYRLRSVLKSAGITLGRGRLRRVHRAPSSIYDVDDVEKLRGFLHDELLRHLASEDAAAAAAAAAEAHRKVRAREYQAARRAAFTSSQRAPNGRALHSVR